MRLLLLLLAFGVNAEPMEFSIKHDDVGLYIEGYGRITPTTFNTFISTVEYFEDFGIKPNRLVLDSRGGTVNNAAKIGLYVKKHKWDTIVQEYKVCASSCSLIFLAGSNKTLVKNAKLKLHRPFNRTKADDPKFINMIQNAMEGYWDDIGANRKLLTILMKYDRNQMFVIDRTTLPSYI